MGLLLTLGLFSRFSALVLMIISTVALATIGTYTIPRGLNLIAWLSWLFICLKRCISCSACSR